MRHTRLKYYLLIMIFIFGCKNETPPNKENLSTILNSLNFKLTIRSCHGNITGKNQCQVEIMIFDNDTITFKTNEKTYVKRLNKSKRDSLYEYFYELLDFHQPDKKIGKDGFGCLYHDYNFIFKNDSLEMTIKPHEGNDIYYRIQELLKFNLYMNIVNGHEYVHQLDSIDFLLFTNHKITDIYKLVSTFEENEKIVGLHLNTTRNDTSFTVIPTPNPSLSFKQLSPISVFQDFSEFSDLIVLTDRYIQPLSSSDTLLNRIIGIEILGIEYKFKPKTKFVDNSKVDIYGIKSKDKFVMTIYFENSIQITIENTGLSLDIYE